MTVFQIVAILFALFMLYVVSIHRKKNTLSDNEMYMWSALWMGFMVISIFPEYLLGVVQVLNFSRVFDLLVVIAFMVLSILVFMSYFKQKELEHKLEMYVRKQAIADIASRMKKKNHD